MDPADAPWRSSCHRRLRRPGHTINGLYIKRPSTDYVGLLGYASSATLRNVGLTNANITGRVNVGSNKTLSVNSYTVNDGNSGANYTVATANDTTGVIIAAANIAAPLPGNTRIDNATLPRISRTAKEVRLKTELKREQLLLAVPPDFICF